MLWYKEEKKVQRGSVYKQARLTAKVLVVGQLTVGNNMEQCAMVYQVSTVTVDDIKIINSKAAVNSFKQ